MKIPRFVSTHDLNDRSDPTSWNDGDGVRCVRIRSCTKAGDSYNLGALIDTYASPTGSNEYFGYNRVNERILRLQRHLISGIRTFQ